MLFDEHIDKEEMRSAFERLSAIFDGGDTIEQYDAAIWLLQLISGYLNQEVEGIDTSPLTVIISEFSKIQSGREAVFLKKSTNVTGKLPDVSLQLFNASICSAVAILRKSGRSIADAEMFVAKLAQMDVKQVAQRRKDFSRRNVLPEIDKIYRQNLRLPIASREVAEIEAKILIEKAKQLLSK